MVAVVRLPMAPSVPSTAMRGQVTSAMRPVNMRRSLLGRRPAHVEDLDAGEGGGGGELRIVVEELVEAVDDAHAEGDGVEHDGALVGGQHPAGGAMPKMKKSGSGGGPPERVGQVTAHGDAVGFAVEHVAGVSSRLGRSR